MQIYKTHDRRAVTKLEAQLRGSEVVGDKRNLVKILTELKELSNFWLLKGATPPSLSYVPEKEPIKFKKIAYNTPIRLMSNLDSYNTEYMRQCKENNFNLLIGFLRKIGND